MSLMIFEPKIKFDANLVFLSPVFLWNNSFKILHKGHVRKFVGLTTKRIFHGLCITSDNYVAKRALSCGWRHGNELTGPLLTMTTYHRHHLNMTGSLFNMTTYHRQHLKSRNKILRDLVCCFKKCSLITENIFEIINNMNPGYFPQVATALKPQTHVSTYSARVWGRLVIYTNIRTVGFCAKTAIIFQWKCICVSDCTYTESMLVNFTQMSLRNIFAMQAVWYQFNRDVAAWKRRGWPSACSKPGGK